MADPSDRAAASGAPLGPLDRLRGWLVTGAPGRGVAFAIDFGAAVWTMLRARRAR